MATLGHSSGTVDGSVGWDTNKAMAIKVTTTSSGSVESLTALVGGGGGVFGNFKGVIWKVSDGSVVGVGSTVGPGFAYDDTWETSTFSSVSLDASTQYWIGLVTDGVYANTKAAGTIGYNLADTSNSFSSPNSFNPTTNTQYLLIYITILYGLEGPGYTIEGQTPAYINTLPWANVGVIK